MTYILTMILVGIFAGIVGAVLGLGGGIVITPVLTLIFQIEIKYAIGAAIIAVLATSSGSAIAYLKDDMLNLRVAMFLEIFTTLGAFIGAMLSLVSDAKFLFILYGLLLTFQAYNMYQKLRSKTDSYVAAVPDKISEKLQLNSSYYDQSSGKTVEYQVTNVPAGSAIMFVAGILSALLGIGSGAFKVLAMDTVMKMPLKPSSATANFMMGVTATASAIFYFFSGQIDPLLAAPIAVGVVIGSMIGSKLMPRIPVPILRVIFIVVLLVSGIQMFLKGL
ncbi:MAG: sulfite exporter TauE/SafE family protein [Streptococcaceae bacterium]|jgi:uncharacterized membrane protein YfcA|nr:sulfite exporter TauE/SafE family protein [Streptococcaceae bacterium]